MTVRSFDPARLRPQSCAFHPKGTLLAVVFSSGACKILDSLNLDEVASLRYTSAPLLGVRFSPDGETVSVVLSPHADAPDAVRLPQQCMGAWHRDRRSLSAICRVVRASVAIRYTLGPTETPTPFPLGRPSFQLVSRTFAVLLPFRDVGPVMLRLPYLIWRGRVRSRAERLTGGRL